MKKCFLLEIGLEEVPALWLEGGVEKLKENICNLLKAKEIYYEGVKTFYTPRRIGIIIDNVAEKVRDKKIEVRGPLYQNAIRPDGSWGEQAIGFAKAQKINLEELKIKKIKEKEFVYCEKIVKGEKTFEILENKLPQIISKIEFPKTMYWEESKFRFARPIRWIVSLIGEKLLKFKIADVETSNFSYGLRFTRKIKILKSEEYEKKVKKRGIIISPEERKRFIQEESKKKVEKEKLKLVEKHEGYDYYELLEEVTNLVEAPLIIMGKFDNKFVKLLPPEVIVTAIRKHQRCFVLENRERKISPYFIIVANLVKGDILEIKKGYEKVINARLEDAWFYFKEDRKTKIEKKVKELKKMKWQEGLGTVYDKITRIKKLTFYLSEQLKIKINPKLVERGVNLLYVDLVTTMIRDGKEFTSLQGIYGSILAKCQKIDPNVVKIIEGVHKGKTTSKETLLLIIADKIDTLTYAFLNKRLPTGSYDPMGIRRGTRILIETLVNNEVHLNLKKVVTKTMEIGGRKEESPKLENEVIKFVLRRMKSMLEERGISGDIIEGVFNGKFTEDITSVWGRIFTLQEFWKKKNISSLVILGKRIKNIVKTAPQKLPLIKVEILKEEEEKKLYEELKEKEKMFTQWIQNFEYLKILTWFFSLSKLVDQLFQNVLIMVKEEEVRLNRLSLLNYLASFLFSFCDFSYLQTKRNTYSNLGEK
jgi:glycyl-tRNA synthetase beta chain